jgi:hypothetical protein
VDVAEDLADALGCHRAVFAGPGRLGRHGDVSRLPVPRKEGLFVIPDRFPSK